MTKARWKYLQEQLATLLQAQRVPLRPGERSRVENDELLAVVRHRAEAPEWLQSAMAGAIMQAGARRMPFVVLTTAAGLAYIIRLERLPAEARSHCEKNIRPPPSSHK